MLGSKLAGVVLVMSFFNSSKVNPTTNFAAILAMGNPVVDYFSLDVEGAELPILKSIPWDKVNIKVRIFGMSIYFITECLKLLN